MMNFLKAIRTPEAVEDPAVVLRMNAIADRGRAEGSSYPRMDELSDQQPLKRRLRSEGVETGKRTGWDKR